MPAPRATSQWPSIAERQARCTVQTATPTTDEGGGRGEPTWTDLGPIWDAKVNVVPVVVNETQATMLYEVEGPYRADMMTNFTSGIGLRILVNDLALKVFEVENPLLRNRTLVAHCAKATNT